MLLGLANHELAAAADQLLALESSAARQRELFVAECKAAQARVDPADRSLQQALRKLWQNKLPGPLADAAAETARQAYSAAVDRVSEATAALAPIFARATRETSDALRVVARQDRFRQALLWQNRSAVHAGVDGLLRQPPDATDSKTRTKERLVASYVQRYCAKNDTIGFFGPCGWARFVDDEQAIVQRPGAELLATRSVYFEYWAIDALAGVLSRDPQMRPFMVPRRLPGFRIEGTTLHYGVNKSAELDEQLADVALRCDGVQTARELATGDEAELFELLDELRDAGAIKWELEIPTAGAHPEHELARLLSRVEPDETRLQMQAPLDELEQGRAAIASARDSHELESALIAFDATFTRITGVESTRAGGQTYAGRTPIYEECRRDLDVEIGRPVLDRLAPPLALVLDSARWFTHEIARRYREQLAAIYLKLVEDGESTVAFPRFWAHVPALFPGHKAPGSIVGDVLRELQSGWAEILAIGEGERTVQRTTASIEAAVRARFAAPGPGWPSARHQSPDLMIAAAGQDAMTRGELRFVLGELHSGFNTIAGPFIKLHPTPDALVTARDLDVGTVGIAPVWSKAVTGADYFSPSPADFDLENGETKSRRPREQVIATSDLVVEARDGFLDVRTRDGRVRFDIIAFVEHHLIAESFAAFSPLPVSTWRPRIAIGDVVFGRETWRFVPSELTWPAIENAQERFLAARRWARSLGMPRWMFLKTPEEVKPMFVDLDSTVYVELLAKELRAASAATLSEMMPTLDETWIIDGSGARYTSELRIATVDPLHWKPEPAEALSRR